MEFLLNSGLSNVVALTEEVFSASSEVFGKVAIKKVLKTSTEFEAFLSLKHENIVEAIEIIEAEEFAFVLMEFAEFGDVFEYIMKNGLMSVEATLSVFSQVVKAVEYCHLNGIAHNDIKLENVLLSNGCVKLADFGFAKSTVVVAESEEFCGTLPYAAPEVIMGMEHNTMKADMWSMGVMLYVMLFSFPILEKNVLMPSQPQSLESFKYPLFPEITTGSVKGACLKDAFFPLC
ncbi:STK22 [Mytilus edulis]|uniref:TSSK n=1 Tax=Mytilus edulis TaxID=6550 RepID=A0A8S3UDW9_MYTED|nr:STK22 [Mytilus edulis]